MPTLSQAFQLGSERLGAAPATPHPAFHDAWRELDWNGARDLALLEAAALTGVARLAGAIPGPPPSEIPPAQGESRPVAPVAASQLLPRLLGDEWRALLPEWIRGCAAARCLAPPLFLPRLLDAVAAPDRAALLDVMGERGRWLARLNPAWSWVEATASPPDISGWERGVAEERLACLAGIRRSDPARAAALIEQTWADDPPEFRLKTLERLRAGLSLADEPLLTRALLDRRKDVRQAAQSLLALLPESGFARRLRERADRLLTYARGLLSRKLEVQLPAAFEAGWKADAIEEKPPAGIGEKAHWTQQMLALIPLRHWAEKFQLGPAAVIELAVKAEDSADLLLGAWYRAAVLHAESDASAALIKVLLAKPAFLPAGTAPPSALNALLAACDDATRWQLAAEHETVAWAALGQLRGTPTRAQSQALLRHLARALSGGFVTGGSAGAVLAARHVLPELREEAARLLTREEGLSKPADAFLQALDLRAALHAAFSVSS